MSFFKNIYKIDEILSSKEVNNDYLDKILSIAQNTEVKIYFWRNVKQKDWFPVLYEAGAFKELSRESAKDDDLYLTQRYISDYLFEMSLHYPGETVEIISSTHSDNIIVVWNFVRIGCRIKPIYTAKLTNKVEGWIKNEYLESTNFAPDIITWFDQLVGGNESKAALKLLKLLATPKTEKTAIIRDKEVEAQIGKATN